MRTELKQFLTFSFGEASLKKSRSFHSSRADRLIKIMKHLEVDQQVES